MAERVGEGASSEPRRTALRQWRERAGFTQEAAAKALNYTQTTISYWENSKRGPGIPDLIALRDLYGAPSIDMLLGVQVVEQQSGTEEARCSLCGRTRREHDSEECLYFTGSPPESPEHQPDDARGHIARMRELTAEVSRLNDVIHGREWKPDPRTVAAVVGLLRESRGVSGGWFFADLVESHFKADGTGGQGG